MAQTIKELTQEREQLLKEIEAQAQQMSNDRNGEPREHTLQDWLTAAENVLPDEPTLEEPAPSQASTTTTRTRRPQARTQTNKEETPMASNKQNRNNVFGVIIMLSLLLTILGVVFIAYTSIQKELRSVLELKEQSIAQIEVLKETVAKLETNIGSGGNAEKVETLEKRVEVLEKSMQEMEKQPVVAKTEAPASPDMAGIEKVLQAHTQAMEAKFERLLQQIAQLNVTPLAQQDAGQEKVKQTKVSKQPEVRIEFKEPQAPQEPSVKPLNQPVVKLVKSVVAPTPVQPAAPQAPLKNYSMDVKWLVSQPAFNYTLQLASMDERQSIMNMIEKHQLQNTRVIPQTKDGNTRYVLVTESIDSKAQANKIARTFKAEYGISPWVRKIKDLTRRVE